MPNLYDYKKEDYAALLASTVLDASKGELFGAAGLRPDTTNRTVFVGGKGGHFAHIMEQRRPP